MRMFSRSRGTRGPADMHRISTEEGAQAEDAESERATGDTPEESCSRTINFSSAEELSYQETPRQDSEEQQRSALLGGRGSRFFRPCATWSDDVDAPEARGPSKESAPSFERADSLRRRERSKLMACLCWFCRPSNMIDPRSSSWLHKWDMLHTFQMAAMSLLWPYETAFLEPAFDLVFVFNRLCDLFLVADMLLQFFVAYPDPIRPERAIKAPRAILMNYLRGWFFADFLSVLPVDFIYLLAKQSAGDNMGDRLIYSRLRYLRYFRAVRLLRLVRFVRLVGRWNSSFGISNAKLTMLKLMATLVLCCHWMSCLWGGIALAFRDEANWLTALRAAKGGPDFPDDDHFSLYSLALYWAIITITSIGYGDITPQSMLEYHVSSICSSIMASIWAYVIGAICGIVSTLDQHEMTFKRTMDDLNWFMEDKDMPAPMRQRLRRYFVEAKEMNKQKVEQEVIKQMSPLLQGEVSMFMHQRWISKVWYLRDMNREIIVWAARNLALAVFAPNEEVLDERTLFILQRGVCAFKGKILVSGDIWGEDMLLSNPYLREQNKARAMSHLSVLTLHIVDLFEVVVCFSEARARLRWAQIQIALTRGIIRIAKKVKAMKEKKGLNTWDMTLDDRVHLYRDILQGLTGDEEDEAVASVKTDFFNLAHRNSMRRSNSSFLEDATETALAGSRTEEAVGNASNLPSERTMPSERTPDPSDKGARPGAGAPAPPAANLKDMQKAMTRMNASLEEVKMLVRKNTYQSSGERTRSLNMDDVYLGPVYRHKQAPAAQGAHPGARSSRFGSLKRMFG